MTTFRILGRLAVVTAIGASIYAIAVHQQISAVPSNTVSFKDSIPKTFHDSKTLRDLVNPRHFAATGDAYSTTFLIPAHHEDASDERLLAWYLKGFFESRVFAPERSLLQTLRPQSITKFSGVQSSSADGKHIWSTQEIPEQKLPPLYSNIFGVFQILAVELPDPGEEECRECVVDVGFGSDRSRFSGCHRLSIERAGSTVHLRLACTSCNPSRDSQFFLSALKGFHQIYAMLLFRAAAARFKQRAEGVL